MQRVAVLTQNRNTRRQIARALGSGGLDTVFFDSAKALAGVLAATAPDLLVVDTDAVSANEVEPLLQRDPTQGLQRPVVLLSVGENRSELLKLIRDGEVANLVAKHGAIRAVFPVLDERELLVTCQKMLRSDIFGLEKYVGLWGVQVSRVTLTGIPDKGPFLAEFEEFLARLDCPARVAPGIATVAEELILNAMVHAPHDAQGQPKYEALGPRPDLEMAPGEYVEVAYCCDGQRLMLSVTDHFGRLSRHKVMDYLGRGLDGEKRTVETKSGGAGLGLSMAFGGLHQLIYNIHENVRTEAIAGWYLRVNDAREFRTVSKSLNLFWLSGEAQPAQVVAEPARRPVTAPGLPSVGLQLTGDVLRLSGRIDESTDLAAVARAAVIEMYEVDGFSSPGVLRWLNMATGLRGREVELAGCPEALVRLGGEVQGLMQNLRVTSVMCPFTCPKCHAEGLVELPPDEVLASPGPECETCKTPLEFQGIQHHYRAFLDALEDAKTRSTP